MASKKGYAERSVELLWGDRELPTRGPKPGVTLERVVQAAVEVADEFGLQALSMRSVAERLGIGTMSLYTYVPGKAELIDLMQDTATGECPLPDPATGWRPQLEQLARGSWILYGRHPWTLEVARLRRVPGPHEVAAEEASLRAVAGLGLTPSEMAATANLVVGYVDGLARRVADTVEHERRTGVSDEAWWSARESLWEKIGDCDPDLGPAFPTITSVYTEGGFDQPDNGFEFGLQRLLDGIQVLVAERQARRGSASPVS